MNFQEYTNKASETAFYPSTVKDFRLAYLALKINGEAGELHTALKTYEMDDDGNPKLQVQNIVKEAGDLLWYLSQESHLLLLHFSSFGFNNYFQDNEYAMFGYMEAIEDNANKIAELTGKLYRDSGGVINENFRTLMRLYVERILNALAYLAVVFNTTLEKIAEINLEKLADRMKRGKLGGSGDDR